MQYQSFLIKYAEIGTKGKNRYMFEDALIRQIRYALSSVDGEFDVTRESGRIYVKALGEYDYDDTIEALKRVFGIADICPMVQIDDKDYENLKKHVVEFVEMEQHSYSMDLMILEYVARSLQITKKDAAEALETLKK